jgi:hypothetical protein
VVKPTDCECWWGWTVLQIHQPLGGARGQATDIELQAHEMMHHKNTLNKFLAEFCGKTMAEMKADTDRDFFLGAHEAVEYGVVDEVLSNPHWDEVSKVNMGMYDFSNYDWRELPTLDPMNEANLVRAPSALPAQPPNASPSQTPSSAPSLSPSVSPSRAGRGEARGGGAEEEAGGQGPKVVVKPRGGGGRGGGRASARLSIILRFHLAHGPVWRRGKGGTSLVDLECFDGHVVRGPVCSLSTIDAEETRGSAGVYLAAQRASTRGIEKTMPRGKTRAVRQRGASWGRTKPAVRAAQLRRS